MLQDFLDRLAGLTGQKYTKAQFGSIVKEAIKAETEETKAAKAKAKEEAAKAKAENE